MINERVEQQLIALIGRVKDNELVKKEQSDLVTLESTIQSWAKLLVPMASGKQTLSADKRISHANSALQVIDANGGERTVFLPSANKGNKFYVVINISS